jgi:hypothetical protein
MLHVLGGVGQDGVRVHHILRTARNLKLMNCLFLEFSILYLWTMVNHGYLEAG